MPNPSGSQWNLRPRRDFGPTFRRSGPRFSWASVKASSTSKRVEVVDLEMNVVIIITNKYV